jgi:DNA-directed RNA polymerase specialized sigma subunit
MKCPHAIRTTQDIRDELERRGVCKISQVRVSQILRKAERKIREALRSELCR